MKPQPQHIFVYGTLIGRLQGKPTPARLPNARMYNMGRYPGVVLKPSNTPVHGFLYPIPSDDQLSALDRYEGAPKLFKRQHVTVITENQEEVLALTYIYARDTNYYTPIISGKWPTPAANSNG